MSSHIFTWLLCLFTAFLPLFSWSQQPAPNPSDKITLAEVTSKLHLSLPPISNPSNAETLRKPIPASSYSLDFARRVLLPGIGGSIAVGDVDGSGYPDLYVVIPGGSNHYFRNVKNGTFAEATTNGALRGTGSDLAATFADYDHSGHASLFVAGLGGVTIYHNNGDGTFTDVTDKAGIKKVPGELATSALLFDAEGNGRLDLLVTVYTNLNAPPTKASFIFPNDFASANSHLYQNQGNGTFREIPGAGGLDENPGRTRKALAADFSHSGHLDLLLLRDNKPPALFKNNGHGEFEDQTWQAGGENWKYAYVDGQISDFNHDGKPDVALWSTIGNEVIVNQGEGKFEQEKTFPIIFAANRAFGFHGATADLTGDGYDDLLCVDNNGGWHYVANHRGSFAAGQVSIQSKESSNTATSATSSFPELSSLIPVFVLKSATPDLIGVTVDGRLMAFEAVRKPVHKKN